MTKRMLLTAALLPLSLNLVAADRTWTGATDGSFSDDGNWSGGQPKTAQDSAIYSAPVSGTQTITIDADWTLSEIRVNAGPSDLSAVSVRQTAGTVTLSGGFQLSAQSSGNQASYRLEGGALSVANAIWIGNGGGTGKFEMSGGTFNVANNWFVLGRGDGSVGHFNQTGGTFTAGAGDILEIGQGTSETASTWTVSGTGTATFDRDVYLGRKDNAAGQGVFTVADEAAVNFNNTFKFDGASGTLNLNGGTVTAKEITASTNSASSLIFNGGTLQAGENAGATLIAATVDTVRFDSGNGTIDTNGKNVAIAAALSGTGMLTKIGAGTLTLSSAGESTLGKIQVHADMLAQTAGTVTLIGGLEVGTVAGSPGTYTVGSGSTLNVTGGEMLVGSNGTTGTVTQAGGDVNFTAAAEEFIYLGSGAGSTGNYTLTGGNLTVGSAGRKMIVGRDGGTGNFAQSGGTFDFEGQWLALAQGNNSVGHFTQTGGAFTTAADTEVEIGQGASEVASTWTVSSASTASFDGLVKVGSGSDGRGAFTVADGAAVNFNNTVNLGGASGTLNLNGGTVTAKEITASTNSDSSIIFNGGTLKAGEEAGATLIAAEVDLVRFDSGNGTIDTNGKNVAIAAVMSGTGVLTKVGAGTLTLSNAGESTLGKIRVHKDVLEQSAGTVTLTGGLDVGTVAGNLGTYIVKNGATLNVTGGVVVVGDKGTTGTISQNGGNVTFSADSKTNIVLGSVSNSVGNYNLNSGTLTVGANREMILGRNGGTGNFTQSFGTFDFQGSWLVLGQSGTGSTAGHFFQTGGTFTTAAGTNVEIGQNADAETASTWRVWGDNSEAIFNGEVNLGRKDSTAEGQGVFTVWGGAQVTFNSTLKLGGEKSIFNLNNGRVTANSIAINSGAESAFVFNGGTLNAGTDAGENFITAAAGGVRFDGNGAINSNGRNVTVSAPLSGPGTLTKQGEGTLTLSNLGTSDLGKITVYAGTVAQAAGTITLDALEVRSNVRDTIYALEAGTLNVTGLAGNSVTSVRVGGHGKTGTFTQTGGSTVNFTAATNEKTFITLGDGTGSTGNYTLSDGALNVGENMEMILGTNGGTGIFTQSGGTVDFDGSLIVLGQYDNSVGQFVQTGGVFTTEAFVQIGEKSGARDGVPTESTWSVSGANTTATFNGAVEVGSAETEANGTFTVDDGALVRFNDTLSLNGASGTLNLSGGTVTAKEITAGTNSDSSIVFDGGTLKAGDSASATLIAAEVDLVRFDSGNGTIDTNGKNVAVAAVMSGTGMLTKIGAGTLTLGGAGESELGRVRVHADTLAQTAGTLTVTNGLEVGTESGSEATYSVGSGSTLNVTGGVVMVGRNGTTGTLTQTGGIVNLQAASKTNIILGSGSGSQGHYTLSDGTLTVGANREMILGVSGGTGTFTQTGGTVDFDGSWLALAQHANSVGHFTQTGGTFTTAAATTVEIGQGTSATASTWTVSGASTTASFDGLVKVGSNSGSNGRGVFTVADGAAVDFNGELNLAGASGTLNLNGGTVTAKEITARGASTTAIVFDGGTLKAGDLASATFIASSVDRVEIAAGGGTVDSNGKDITIGRGLVGTGALSKQGDGTLTLSGDNTGYTGSIAVSGGNVALASGATLLFAVDGSKTAADNAHTFANGSNVVIADSAVLQIELSNVGELYSGQFIDLFIGAAVSIPNADLIEISLLENEMAYSFKLTTNGQLEVMAIPEPSTYALLAGGLALGLAVLRRRKKA